MLESLVIFMVIAAVMALPLPRLLPTPHIPDQLYSTPSDRSKPLAHPGHLTSSVCAVLPWAPTSLSLPLHCLFISSLSRTTPSFKVPCPETRLLAARGCSHLIYSTHMSEPLCNGLESGSSAYCRPWLVSPSLPSLSRY